MTAHAHTDWLAYALALPCLIVTLICRWLALRAQRRERGREARLTNLRMAAGLTSTGLAPARVKRSATSGAQR